jgi:chemotaxis protein CheD
MRRILKINDIFITSQPMEFTCYGLGSCIGLFVSDRVKGLSGGAHIPLPEAEAGSAFDDAGQMIERLLGQFSAQGSDLLSLRAKITGGAQIVQSAVDVGRQNIHSVVGQLIYRKVFIAAMDVGGRIARTARFNSVTGEVKISTSEQKTYFI